MNKVNVKKSAQMTASAGWMKESGRDKAMNVVIYVVLVLVALTCLLPFLHVLAKSLSADAFVIANKVYLLPKDFTLDAYVKIFQDSSILRSLWISVIVTVLFTVCGMFQTICAAYALSRPQLKGRRVLTFLCMFTLYFTGGIIPEYMLISSLGLLDSIWSLVLPLSFSAYNLLIMKNSLTSSIPVSLEESARIDGAGHFRILWSIVIPLSRPIIATLSLFYAVGRWNAYQDALFYIKGRTDLRPLQLKLYYLIVQASESFQLENATSQLSNPEVMKAACIIFATLPILIVYPFVSKYFVQGVMVGAVKE